MQRGRYLVGEAIAEGGMATVHMGQLAGEAGFSRTVAIKCLRGELASNVQLRNQLVDEARLVSRIRHANVVQTLDVIADGDRVFLVLEYVPGASLAHLKRTAGLNGELVPPRIASAIIFGALRGLHAAHEATSEERQPLGIVHRDVSPQNVLVGIDGETRVLDFGIAKAKSRLSETTTQGEVRGKLAYMAPEQLAVEPVDLRCDLFSAAVVMWEALAGKRLFAADEPCATMNAIFHGEVPRLAGLIAGATSALDGVLARALAKKPSDRFATADEMARALENVLPPASPRVVAAWVQRVAKVALDDREERVAAFECAAARARALSTYDDDHDTAELSKTFCPRRSPPLVQTRAPEPTIPDDAWAPLAASLERPAAPPAELCSSGGRPAIARCTTPLAMTTAVSTGEILAWRQETTEPDSGSVVVDFPPGPSRRPMTRLALLLVVLPLVALATFLSGRPGPRGPAMVAAVPPPPAVSLPAAPAPATAASASVAAAASAAPIAAPPASVMLNGRGLPSAKGRPRPSNVPMAIPVRLPMRVD